MATADFLTATSRDDILAHRYIEIEGIRVRYGDLAPSWNPADSGTNRPIKEYFTEHPRITGQVAQPLNGSTTPHKFSVSILDVAEEITALFSVADTDNPTTTVTDAGGIAIGETAVDVADASEIAINDDIYIDRETMRVTNIVGNTLTVTRGMYGSEEVEHLLVDDQDNARSLIVYTAPPFLYTREVVLCEGRTDLLEADVIKFRGYLESADESNGVYTLNCAGYLRRLNCMICESLAHLPLNFPLWDEGLVVWEPDEDGFSTGITATTWAIQLPVGADHFQSNGHVLIDEEIIKYESVDLEGGGLAGSDQLYLSSDTTFNPGNIVAAAANRGLFAEEILGSRGVRTRRTNQGSATSNDWYEYQVSIWCARHEQGSIVQEIFHSQRIKDELSLSDSEPLKASDIILTLLLSQEGDDVNDATYDKLPPGWGAGIPSAKVDKTEIINVCAHPSIDEVDFHPFAITEAVDCKEWLEENVLRPCHLFFVENDEGKISVARLYSKNEAIELTTPTALTEDDLLAIPRFKPGQAPLGEFSFDVNWHPGRDEFLGKVNVILADGRAHYMGTARKFDLECKTVYDSRIGMGRGNWLSGEIGDAPNLLANYLEVIWKNFALVPCPVVSFPVSYAMHAKVQVGKVVTLTSSQTPDVKNSDRGISAEYFQVVESHPDPEQSCVNLVCWMIGINDADTRLLAPAAKVKAYDAGPPVTVTLYDTTFTDGVKYTYDIDAFATADDVMFVDSAYDGLGGGAPEHAAISAINASGGADDGSIEFAAAPPNPPGDGDYVVTGNYANSQASQKAKWAYLADTTPDLNTDAPHKYDR